MVDMVEIKNTKTSELLDWTNICLRRDERNATADELMSRFPFDLIGELKDRITEIENQAQRMLNHIHGPTGRVFIR